jgi:hypothetical protein
VCGDCCVLTEQSAKTWAICLSCDGRGGRSLARGWSLVLMWVGLPLMALTALVVLLSWLFE